MPERPPSHLFYQTRRRRPLKERSEGVYIWDIDGNRWLGGSSGAMVCNLGHANPHVIAAMRRQLDKGAFGYACISKPKPPNAWPTRPRRCLRRASTGYSSPRAARKRWRAR